MKSIEELVNFYNDDQIFITSEKKTIFTFTDLKKQVNLTKIFFENNSICKNDTIALVIDNGPDMASCFLSVASFCCAAPLNPTYTISEFNFFLEDLKPKALIIKENYNSQLIDLALKKGIKVINLFIDNFTSSGHFFLKLYKQSKINIIKKDFNIIPKDTALILHTSGTTSRPKMVPLTNNNLCNSAKNIVKTLKLVRSDRCINIMPLFHIHGIVCLLLAPLFSGGSVFASTGFNALKFFNWIKDFSPTWYSAVPTMHQAILTRANRNNETISMSKLRFIRSSSAPLPSKSMKEMEKIFNCPVIESYGMTETSHQMTSNLLPPGIRKALKVGVAAGPEVAIIDNKNNFLPKGKIGEIIIKGESVTKGYINNPEANKNSFINDWFRTGDQGFFDKKNFLQITGRLKEIINKGGEKIMPLEIDDKIMQHESIFQAITFPIAHKILGEEIAAAVVLKNNHQLNAEELKKFLSNKIASFKIPQKIIFVDEIPKGKTGKLKRLGLAKILGLE